MRAFVARRQTAGAPNGSIAQDRSSEEVAVHGESTPLGIGQPQAPPVKVLLEDAVLFPHVLDDLKLAAIHPARECHEQAPQPDGVDHGPSRLAPAYTSLG